MNWQRHSTPKKAHAFLSPSNYHWLNYTPEKLEATFRNSIAAERGTRLHEFAAECIELGQLLYEDGSTLSKYVNDCIVHGMEPEKMLYFSENCFGTADAISFNGKLLRIYDLKTGQSGDMKQLMIYAALFCLDYDYDPREIEVELSLYINDDVLLYDPAPEEIGEIIAIILEFDSILSRIREEV